MCSKKYWDNRDYNMSGSTDFVLVSRSGIPLFYPDHMVKSTGMITDRTRGYSYETISGDPKKLMTLDEYAELLIPAVA